MYPVKDKMNTPLHSPKDAKVRTIYPFLFCVCVCVYVCVWLCVCVCVCVTVLNICLPSNRVGVWAAPYTYRFSTTPPTVRTPVTGNADQSQKDGSRQRVRLLWFPVALTQRSWGLWPFTEGWEAVAFFFRCFFLLLLFFFCLFVSLFFPPKLLGFSF